MQLLAAPIALSLAESSQDGTTTDDTAESHSHMDSNTEGLVTITSDESVQATVSRIEAAIEESPLTLMTTVDHADNPRRSRKNSLRRHCYCSESGRRTTADASVQDDRSRSSPADARLGGTRSGSRPAQRPELRSRTSRYR